MGTRLLALCFLVFCIQSMCPALAGSRREAPRLEFRPEDEGAPVFVLSAAAATSSDPVVISVKDRAMTSSDRAWRTELQRYWLEVNVPDDYDFVDRSQVLVLRRRKGSSVAAMSTCSAIRQVRSIHSTSTSPTGPR